MARAPIPSKFPGQFFVLSYSRHSESYTVFFDDDSRSSHRLGHDVPIIIRTLELWGLPPDFSANTVGAAREFGRVQCIPDQLRYIPLIPRTPATPTFSFEEPTNENAYL